MLNLSNNNRNESEDLKFVPFNTKDNILSKGSSWFPVVKLNTPIIENTVTNNFLTDFSTPISKFTVDDTLFNKIDNKITQNEEAKQAEEMKHAEQIKQVEKLKEKTLEITLVKLKTPIIVDTVTAKFSLGFTTPINKFTFQDNQFNNMNYKNEDIIQIEETKEKEKENVVNKPISQENPFNIAYKSNYTTEIDQEEKEENKNNCSNSYKCQYVCKPHKSTNSSKKSKSKHKRDGREGNFDEPIHMKILRDYNLLELDKEKRNELVTSVEEVYNILKSENRDIFDALKLYEIPSPMVDIIVKRIIKLTIENEDVE